MPWLMQAAARGETGTETGVTAEIAGVETGTALVGATAFSTTSCGFESSFFHIGHLDIENGIFEAAYRRAGWELRL
jgi:hypothetical protein